MTLENCKILNRDQIKLLAVVTMTLNHFAHVFLTPGTVLCEVLQDIGYFTAMTMCFFLVEGYRYTRSRKDYARRLLAFAILSQVPYVMALGIYQLNVLFTLLICFLILCLMDSAMAPWKRRLSIFGLFLVSCACDWSFMLPMGAVLLKRGEGQPRRQVLAYAAVAGIFWLLNIPGYMDAGVGSALLHSFYAILGIAASAAWAAAWAAAAPLGSRVSSGIMFSSMFFLLRILFWVVGFRRFQIGLPPDGGGGPAQYQNHQGHGVHIGQGPGHPHEHGGGGEAPHQGQHPVAALVLVPSHAAPLIGRPGSCRRSPPAGASAP